MVDLQTENKHEQMSIAKNCFDDQNCNSKVKTSCNAKFHLSS